MLAAVQPPKNPQGNPADESLSALLEVAECAVATRSRIPVLSLWNRMPSIALFASHLHLRWPGRVLRFRQ
jgi:hypothetical protein